MSKEKIPKIGDLKVDADLNFVLPRFKSDGVEYMKPVNYISIYDINKFLIKIPDIDQLFHADNKLRDLAIKN